MQKSPKKLFAFKISPQILELLNDLEDKTGTSKSEIVRQAIMAYHSKTFKDYIQVQKERIKVVKDLNPEQREQMKMDRDEAKKGLKDKKVHENGLRVCELLEGDTYNEGGVDYCKFTCFEYMNPSYVHQGIMTLPFDELTEDLLEIKWKGGKDKIQGVLNKQK